MSDIQEQIKLAHKRAEENDIKLLQEEIKEIFNYFIKYANIEDSIKISKLEDYITNLQEENEYSNHCNEELRKKITNLEYKIERLEEDNKQLKELCDKYEEEHKTTFEEWKKDINIIDKLEKYLDEEQIRLARECSNIYEDSLGKTKIVNEDIFNEITKIKDKLNELKGDNK